jgi:hypothetical protein
MIELKTEMNTKDIPKPYSYKKVRTGWFSSIYHILYEDAYTVYEYAGNEIQIQNIVEAMNIAYRVGCFDQMTRNSHNFKGE